MAKIFFEKKGFGELKAQRRTGLMAFVQAQFIAFAKRHQPIKHQNI
jgi:hypothetical protein